MTKYRTNDTFFDNIDTEQKAYIFGFICGDGYNHETNRAVAIRINDLDLLCHIRDALSPNRPILRVGGKAHLLSISSVKLSRSLAVKGCKQGKSITYEFPSQNVVPERLRAHFVRGYFDADGSVYEVKNSSRLAVEIIATRVFCDQLSTFLPPTIEPTIRDRSYTTMSDIRISRQLDIIEFRNWIYRDATIWLPRKRALLDTLHIASNNAKKTVRMEGASFVSDAIGMKRSNDARRKQKEGWAVKSGLFVNGEPVSLEEAARRVGRHPSTITARSIRHRVTLQQAIDFYVAP